MTLASRTAWAQTDPAVAASVSAENVPHRENPYAEALASRASRPWRLVAEPVVGVLLGGAFGALGALAARATVCAPGEPEETCTLATVAGGYLGFVFGAPLGVMAAGHWIDGLGSYPSALLGTLAGVALAIPVSLLAREEWVTFASAALPIAGGVLGYELRARHEERERIRAQLSLSPAGTGLSLVMTF